MMMGSYYCFEIPASLKNQMDDYFGSPSDYELNFSLLYTLYSAPNVIKKLVVKCDSQCLFIAQVILPFFGGCVVDRFGVRFSLLVFVTLLTVGQVFIIIHCIVIWQKRRIQL